MFPQSIRGINALPPAERQAIYRTLIPQWVYEQYHIDPQTQTIDGQPAVFYRAMPGSRSVELTLRLKPADRDPLMYLNMADTFNHQLLVLLVVFNDLNSPRFDTDVDEHGHETQFGTVTRNIPAEVAAMQAGLAPGQVRAGLRAFKSTVPIFEQFVRNIGHDLFLIEPLSYHNAIVFERYGFNYVQGRNEMHSIHEGFQPGGALHRQLTGANPFRQPEAWKTVRGRSWAIHDGILGHPFTGFQMYKRIGVHAGINTFPSAGW